MVETFNSSKTSEILARYRPIAPKPLDNNEATENNSNPINPTSSDGMHQKIRDSPYLRNIWPHMQARSTRTRRRNRTVLGPALPPSIYKRQSPNPTHAFSPYQLSPNSLSSFHVFLPNSTTSPVQDLVINKQIPVEKDLLAQLQAHAQASRVVTPRPVRLVSSAISVQQQSTISNPGVVVQGRLKAVVEIEEEVESESLPIVVSDSNHKVRLVNSANYKKLVGQPECCWVPSVVREAVTCNRICGEVMLQIPEFAGEELVSSSNGFFCLVVIEWGNSEYKSSITTFGEAVRLFCESRDYMFAWRFHTQGASSSPPNI